MKKAIAIGAVVLIAALAAAVYFLLSGLGGIVKAAVEKYGSEVTQVAVTLDEAEVAPTEGRAALRGLEVGNPAGFRTDNAFEMGSISVVIDAATVTKDPVVIKEVAIANPVVTYELGEAGSNIDAIKRNVERAGSGDKKARKSEWEGPKVVIRNLIVRGGKVNVSAVPLGGKRMTAPLPDIHLKDIGAKSGGATPGEIAEIVTAALTKRVGAFVAGLDLSSVFQGVTQVPEALKGLKGVPAGTAGEAAKGALEGAGKTLKGTAKEAGKALDKLLGQ